MNPQIQAALNLINQVFVANGAQEITATNSNPVLIAILQSLYGLTGNNLELDTTAKDNLVDAINEVNGLVSQLNSIQLYEGSADPNVVPPNSGDTNILDFYQQTESGNAIALWISTGVAGLGWLNLTSKDVLVSANLPTSGVVGKIYVRTIDNTLWRWELGGSIQYPNPTFVQLGSSIPTILINGNSFLYRKRPTNLTNNIVAGDIATMGWINNNDFGIRLVYVSGIPTSSSSWTIEDAINY